MKTVTMIKKVNLPYLGTVGRIYYSTRSGNYHYEPKDECIIMLVSDSLEECIKKVNSMFPTCMIK